LSSISIGSDRATVAARREQLSVVCQVQISVPQIPCHSRIADSTGNAQCKPVELLTYS